MKKFHLSTYISITITLLVIGSTLVISGILYFSLSKSLTSEFEDRVGAQCGETLQILSGRFQETDNRLRELSLDNTIRVTLMLGVYQQLKEHLSQKYRSDNGTYFFIRPLNSEKLFKSSISNLSRKKLSAILTSSSAAGKLVRFGKYGFIYSLSYPVFRQKDRIGTAYAIYILNKDETLLKSVCKHKTSSIIKINNGRAWNILTGKIVKGFNLLTEKIKKQGLSYIVLNNEKAAVVVNREFPDLIYLSGLNKLNNAKIKVLRPVLYSLAFVLILTITISLFLSRLLARPLSELSQLSLKIAEGKPYTDGKRISSNVIEVGQLMLSLSIMVNNLKKTEELKRYQQLFEGVADPVFIYDFSGKFLEVNQIALDQFGFSKQEFENTTFTNIIPEKQCNKIAALIEDISRTGGPVVFETEIFTKNSTLVYVECHAKKIIFKGKKAVLSVARDITDRKKIQHDLVRSEERLSLALEVSLAITWEFNLKTEKFKIDTDKFKLPGYERADLEKVTDILNLINPNNIKKVRRRFKEFIKGNKPYYQDEFSIITVNGEQRWLNNRAKVIKFDQDNKPMIIIGTAIDISELKMAEQALRDNEERYRTILDNRNIGYVEVDLKGNLTFFNEALCDITGYSPDELFGMNYKTYTDDKTSEEIKRKYRAIFKTGKSLKSFEYPAFRKSGDLVTVEASVSLMKDPNGRACGFRALIIDITERKRAEQERKKFESELRQSHKMEAIGTLSGGIAHDFNNILSGIFGYCQLAEMNIDNPVKAKSYVGQVFKGAKRAASLIQQILTFTRQTDHEKQLLEVSIVVKEALKLLRSSIPSTIEIKENVFSDKNVMADPTQIHQVVMNLCTNAYHAMRDKGGKLEVELNDIEISQRNSLPDMNILPGEYIRLKVSDTGHGMDKETMGKMFDPYFSTKKAGEGTGLGLALVYAIIEDHKGYIKAYSTVGKGTEFYVFLPVEDKKDVAMHPSGSRKPLKGGQEKIMVVDDEKSILDSIEEFLKDYGYTVTTFSNGAEAFEEFKKSPDEFDLVITDMTMPHMTGDKLSAGILKIKKDIPIILCTGYNENISKDKALELGIKQYIQKPIDSEELVSLIRELLDK